MKICAALIILLSFTVHANEFSPVANTEKALSCGFAKGILKFDGLVPQYSLYDLNSKTIKINKCTVAIVGDLTFYTVEFESEVIQGTEPLKVLTLEIALADPKLNTIRPVRSEIIDQYSEHGDIVHRKFTTKGAISWGKSSKDGQAMLKFEITAPKEKPFSYLLKLNKKKSWFENIF